MKIWLKLFVVMAMSFAILIPLMMIYGLIQGRKHYRDEAVRDIASHVGQAQLLRGPVLVVPYVEVVEKEVVDEKGISRRVRENQSGQWHFFPETLHANGTLAPQVRKRGLHEVRVYDWQGELAANFDLRLPATTQGKELRLGQAFIFWGIADVRGLRGTPQAELDGKRQHLHQGSGIEGQGGLHVRLQPLQPGEALRFASKLTLRLAGTEHFGILPLAGSNDIRLKSSWPHPSFTGILPQHDINAQGFEARWQVDALATQAQQYWRTDNAEQMQDVARVTLLDPVNRYLLAERASKYGVLFVFLTFAGFFMFELIRQVRVHPVQYALVGLAIAIFFLLLLSLSEHMPFAPAYLVAALACTGLIGFYLCSVFASWRQGFGFAALLATLYTALYGLLILEDNALVVGSGLLFLVLAAIMVATRKVDWYALGADKRLPPQA